MWTFLAKVEREWGVKFPPGSNPGVTFMAHLWEPLRTCHKPLAIHLASEGWGLCLRLLLKTMGFRRAVQQVKEPAQAVRIATLVAVQSQLLLLILRVCWAPQLTPLQWPPSAMGAILWPIFSRQSSRVEPPGWSCACTAAASS